MSSQESRESCFEDRPDDARGPETAQAQHPSASPSPLASEAASEDGLPFSSDAGLGLPPRWDGNDPQRKKDCFAPPAEPCECHCLHCGRTFMSNEIWFQKVINDPQGFAGFWMCPTPNCSGAGFTF